MCSGNFSTPLAERNEAVKPHSEGTLLDRASGYGSEGQEFESLRACQENPETKVSGFLLFKSLR